MDMVSCRLILIYSSKPEILVLVCKSSHIPSGHHLYRPSILLWWISPLTRSTLITEDHTEVQLTWYMCSSFVGLADQANRRLGPICHFLKLWSQWIISNASSKCSTRIFNINSLYFRRKPEGEHIHQVLVWHARESIDRMHSSSSTGNVYMLLWKVHGDLSSTDPRIMSFLGLCSLLNIYRRLLGIVAVTNSWIWTTKWTSWYIRTRVKMAW